MKMCTVRNMAAIKGLAKLKKELFKIQGKLLAETVKIFNTNSTLLATHLKQNYLKGGTTSSRLKVRSTRLSASVKPLKAKKIKGGLIAGIRVGTVYAGVHIGKKGHVTTIRPKRGKFLAIPLDAAKTDKAGVARGGPRDEHLWGETFVRRSKAGNLIIFGKQKYGRGKKAGQTRGKLVPLFVLKKSVKVKTRVDAKELLKWLVPKIIRDMEKIKL